LNNPSEKIIIIAKVGSRFGVKGQFRIYSFTDPVSNFGQYNKLFIKIKESWREFNLTELKYHKGNTFMAKTECIDTPESVSTIVNCPIGILETELPPLNPDEYYWNDLLNLHVTNKEGVKLGTVDHVFSCGANDVIEITGEHPCLIPYTNNVILNVNLKDKTLLVDWDPSITATKNSKS
jgi:16S rRNA processing protein RimM